MHTRYHRFIGRLLALLLMAQALLPGAAFAAVRVRCVGAPPSAGPCAQALVPASDTTPVGTMRAGMACCRTMTACHAMRGCPAASVSAPGGAPSHAAFSALKCLVSVTTVCTKQAAVAPSSQQRSLLDAPAHAPPAVSLVDSALTRLSADIPPRSFSLPPDFTTHAHGLRAPPCV